MNAFNGLKTDVFTTDFNQRIDLSGYVIFIENSDQTEIVNYIKSNYNTIQQHFKVEGKRFVVLSEIENTSSILKPLRYHYPRLTKDDVWSNLNFETLKDYLRYKGSITTGLLAIDTVLKTEFIEFDSTCIIDFKNLTESYLSDYNNKLTRLYNSWDNSDDMICSGDYNSDDNIKLDDETKKRVDSILNEFEALKDKGNLLQIIPIVEGYLKTQHTSYLNELSTLKIDENFTIFLRDYNLEIKLSHLTKSVYLLFLNHPEGILINELKLHKAELLSYYKNVSNRIDLDKMNNSIDDLIDTKSNAIYVHLSRIKSAFTKVVHQSIAQHYYIDGGKNKPKKIGVRSELLIWHRPISHIQETPLTEEAKVAIENAKKLLRRLGVDMEK